MYKLTIYLKKKFLPGEEKPFDYSITEDDDKETFLRDQMDFSRIEKIPLPSKNVTVFMEDNGSIYILNRDKPWDIPWNVGVLIKDFLLKTTKRTYW